MKKFGSIGFLMLALCGCSGSGYLSPDYNNPDLLPERGDYLSTDYGTKELANEVYKAYAGYINDTVNIKLISYDNETRTKPLIVFAENKWRIRMMVLSNGALEFGYSDFRTGMMPLEMTTNIKVFLKMNATKDTIKLHGMGGTVRTAAAEGQAIGTPLPESDDAELEGYYVRSSKKLFVVFDLMLPIALKAHITGKK